MIAEHRQTITELITQVSAVQDVKSAVKMAIQTNTLQHQKMQKTVQNLILLHSNISSQGKTEATQSRSTAPHSKPHDNNTPSNSEVPPAESWSPHTNCELEFIKNVIKAKFYGSPNLPGKEINRLIS